MYEYCNYNSNIPTTSLDTAQVTDDYGVPVKNPSWLFSLNIIDGYYSNWGNLISINTNGRIKAFADKPGNYTTDISIHEFANYWKKNHSFTGNLNNKPKATLNVANNCGGSISTIEINNVIQYSDTILFIYFDYVINNTETVPVNFLNASLFVDGSYNYVYGCSGWGCSPDALPNITKPNISTKHK